MFMDYSAKGIGFTLTQEHPEDNKKKQLIFFGSSSLSEKQKRLPVIYGENLGIVVALEKCRFWFGGLSPFLVSRTGRPWSLDHRHFRKKITLEAHISSVQSVDKYEERLHSDPLLDHIWDQGALDHQYTALVQAIQQKQTKNWVLNSSDNPCHEYASMWERLGTLDTRDPTLLTLDIRRLVIPIQAKKKILEVLHYSHEGINKTYAAARSRYF